MRKDVLMLTAAAALAFALPAAAEGLRSARLVAGAPGEAGLDIKLEPGWKTYWRIAGEAGIAPEFDWSESRNLAGLRVLWPRPRADVSLGMPSFVYKDAVLLPLELTPEDPSRPVELSLKLFFGVCKEICIPAQADISRAFAPDETGEAAAEIAAARAEQPGPASRIGLREARCGIVGAGAERRFSARLDFDAPPGELFAVAEGPEGAWIAPTDIRAEGAALHVSAEMFVDPPDMWIGRNALTLTLIGADGAWTVEGCRTGG